MNRLSYVLVFLIVFSSKAQETSLPQDLRQHTLTQFNASLLNPAFSNSLNNPSSLSVWTRWQWQTIDADPTTWFANYTQKLNNEAAVGIGFLQHNTGVFLNSGGIINYAQAIPFGDTSSVTFGVNLSAFQRQAAQEPLGSDLLPLPQFAAPDAFLIQVSPGVRFQFNRLNLGFTIENALDFNLTEGRRDGLLPSQILFGSISNDFPIGFFDKETDVIRPLGYVRTIPGEDTQFGGNLLLSTTFFWLQGGYNSFYGFSGGAGVTLFNRLSLGGLVEVGADDFIRDQGTTFEVLASYHFGKLDKKKKLVQVEEKLKKEEEQKRLVEEKEKKEAEALALEEKRREELEAKRLAGAQQRKDSLQQAQEQRLAELVNQKRLDSIANTQRLAAERIREAAKRDSIAALSSKDVDIKPNEKYEEVAKADGLQPGFYLIANVFGTQRYFENFMRTLQNQGLTPGSFLRETNGYNYVYLERFATIEEARRARDSKYFGKYQDKTWIFRVRGE